MFYAFCNDAHELVWANRRVFPRVPPPFRPRSTELWPLSHPFDYYSPALFKEWSADIFLSRSVGRPFLFFYSVGHMSAFRAGSFFLFFLGSHQEQEQLSWGIRARLLYLSPCLLFYFYFPSFFLWHNGRKYGRKEWENSREP